MILTSNIIQSHELSENYAGLLQALDGKESIKDLIQQADINPGLRDLVLMANDPEYIRLFSAQSDASRARLFEGSAREGAGPATEFEQYARTNYPEGWKLVNEYHGTTGRGMSDDAVNEARKARLIAVVTPIFVWVVII